MQCRTPYADDFEGSVPCINRAVWPGSSNAGRDSEEAEKQRWVEVLTSLLTGTTLSSPPLSSHTHTWQVAVREGCQPGFFRRRQESDRVEAQGKSSSSLPPLVDTGSQLQMSTHQREKVIIDDSLGKNLRTSTPYVRADACCFRRSCP